MDRELYHCSLPEKLTRQVSWLPAHSASLDLPIPFTRRGRKQWRSPGWLPGYSGGTARGFHPVPYSLLNSTFKLIFKLFC